MSLSSEIPSELRPKVQDWKRIRKTELCILTIGITCAHPARHSTSLSHTEVVSLRSKPPLFSMTIKIIEWNLTSLDHLVCVDTDMVPVVVAAVVWAVRPANTRMFWIPLPHNHTSADNYRGSERHITLDTSEIKPFCNRRHEVRGKHSNHLIWRSDWTTEGWNAA